jgi:hypothetical protein
VASNQICSNANCFQVIVIHKKKWIENHGDAVALVLYMSTHIVQSRYDFVLF